MMILFLLSSNHGYLKTDEGDVYMLGGKHHGSLSDSERLNAVKSLPGIRINFTNP